MKTWLNILKLELQALFPKLLLHDLRYSSTLSESHLYPWPPTFVLSFQSISTRWWRFFVLFCFQDLWISFVVSFAFAWKVGVIMAINAVPLYVIKLIHMKVAPAALSKLVCGVTDCNGRYNSESFSLSWNAACRALTCNCAINITGDHGHIGSSMD